MNFKLIQGVGKMISYEWRGLMNRSKELLYVIGKKEMMTYLTILVIMLTATFASCNVRFAYSSDDIESNVNSTLSENMENYAGIFSTAVTASVNPTATLSILSFVGTIEKADEYFPNAKWLEKPQNVLLAIPFVRTAHTLPIANPVAGVIFAVIAVTLIVVKSIPYTGGATDIVNKIEGIGGYITTVALSLLPLVTTQTVEAAEFSEKAAKGNVVSAGTYAVMIVLGLISVVYVSIVYIIVNKCVAWIELIISNIPVGGAVGQALKAALHVTLVILQVISPVLSVIFSILIFIICIFLFRWLMTITKYYDYVYVKPLWKKVFNKNEITPFLHKKFPKKARKAYPELDMAIPAFSMHKRGKFVKKKSILWMTEKDGEVVFLRVKRLGKIREIKLEELNPYGRELYLQKAIRFTQIVSEDKTVEIIFSNEYSDRWEVLLHRLQLQDYKVVQERLASEDKVTMKNWNLKLKKKFRKA